MRTCTQTNQIICDPNTPDTACPVWLPRVIQHTVRPRSLTERVTHSLCTVCCGSVTITLLRIYGDNFSKSETPFKVYRAQPHSSSFHWQNTGNSQLDETCEYIRAYVRTICQRILQLKTLFHTDHYCDLFQACIRSSTRNT